jgi:hypothetical protein
VTFSSLYSVIVFISVVSKKIRIKNCRSRVYEACYQKTSFGFLEKRKRRSRRYKNFSKKIKYELRHGGGHGQPPRRSKSGRRPHLLLRSADSREKGESISLERERKLSNDFFVKRSAYIPSLLFHARTYTVFIVLLRLKRSDLGFVRSGSIQRP